MARFAALLLLSFFALVAIAAADDVGVDIRNRKLLSGGGGAFSQADASARAFIDDWKRGHRRAPHFSECEAAASASASSFSFGKGAFSAADADAEAEARGFDDWRGKFITACQASASAHAESSSSGGGVASASAEAHASAGSGHGKK